MEMNLRQKNENSSMVIVADELVGGLCNLLQYKLSAQTCHL